MTVRKLEIEAAKNWDIFYKQNTTNFYKDRHYIHREFTQLSNALEKAKEQKEASGEDAEVDDVVLLDLGCGVGNAFYPLVESYGLTYFKVQACDFSQKAVNFVKENILYNQERIDAQKCDLVKDQIPFEPLTAQYGHLIFVLSAISPANYVSVVTKIYE